MALPVNRSRFKRALYFFFTLSEQYIFFVDSDATISCDEDIQNREHNLDTDSGKYLFAS